MSRAPDDRALALHAEVLAALPGDPYVVHDLDATPLEAVATEPSVAAAVLTRHLYRGVRWVTALAADPAAAEHECHDFLRSQPSADGPTRQDALREALRRGDSPRNGLPLGVARHIDERSLYQA